MVPFPRYPPVRCGAFSWGKGYPAPHVHPEDQALEHIDQALEQAGWRVQDYKSANLQVGRGVVLRNFSLASGHGFADYLFNPVFSFHLLETLAALIPQPGEAPSNLNGASLATETSTPLRARLKTLPSLSTAGLWPAQVTAITNLEKPLAQDRPRA